MAGNGTQYLRLACEMSYRKFAYGHMKTLGMAGWSGRAAFLVMLLLASALAACSNGGEGLLYSTVVERLPPSLHPVRAIDEPVVGSALAALDAAGADDKAKARLRSELRGR